MSRQPPAPSLVAQLALLLAAALWGASFLATKAGMADAGPLGLVALRFSAAALVLLPFAGPLRAFTSAELATGSLVAVFAMGGYATQALALQSASSARVAFLSALYVPLVPILQFAMFRERAAPTIWLGMAFGLVGVGVMSGLASIDTGAAGTDLLILASALAIGLEVVVLGRLANRGEPTRIALVTVAAIALIAALLATASGERIPTTSPRLGMIVAGFGAATAYIQFAMSWGQRLVPSSRAAMIYSLEPVFGGLIGLAAGEALHASDLLGGALIVFGTVIASLPWREPANLVPISPREPPRPDIPSHAVRADDGEPSRRMTT